MYAWFYRHLPGPHWVRILICLGLCALAVFVLFNWVFPLIAPYMPFNGATVE
ncbi:hypothetical protein ACUH9Y_08440 [Dermabacteraceae bacterium P13115]